MKILKEFYRINNNENLFKLLFIIINSLFFLLLINTNFCVPITIILFLIYFLKSKISKEKKLIILLTWITFSICTILGESLTISVVKKSLKYMKTDFYNVPIWLFTAYGSMVMSVFFLEDFFNFLISKN